MVTGAPRSADLDDAFTSLTSLGVEPPSISVWAFGEQVGRVVERPPGP